MGDVALTTSTYLHQRNSIINLHIPEVYTQAKAGTDDKDRGKTEENRLGKSLVISISRTHRGVAGRKLTTVRIMTQSSGQSWPVYLSLEISRTKRQGTTIAIPTTAAMIGTLVRSGLG